MQAISPQAFDLIVTGTGLEESLLAAAAAQAGRSVLHVDPTAAYGAHWGTLPLSSLLQQAAPQPQGPPELQGATAAAQPALPEELRGCTERALQGAQQLLSCASLHQHSRAEDWAAYNVDLAGKAVMCSGQLLDALLGCSAHHYLEFKLVQASYVWRGGRLRAVPASRADIFRERALAAADKRALMRFLKAAGEALQGRGSLQEAFDARPFVGLLEEQELARPLRDVVIHALALVDEPQEGRTAPAEQGEAEPQPSEHRAASARGEPGKGPARVSAAEGLRALGQYLHASGKYGQGTGAFMLPLWGLGELAQAFCRAAAVKGALYVLRCPLTSALVDPGSNTCRGVRTAGGQVLRCHALAGSQEALGALSPASPDNAQPLGVSRAICITDRPLQADEHQVVAVFPPWAAPLANPHAIRVVQASWQTHAAPEHRYVLYFSTPAGGASPEADLRPAVASLLALPPPDSSGEGTEAAGGGAPAPVEALAQGEPAQRRSPAAGPQQAPGGLEASSGGGGGALPGEGPQLGADAAGDAGALGGKPRALLELYYRLGGSRGGQTGAERACPGNVAVSPLPDARLSCDGAVASAAGAFGRLFPELAGAGQTLFGGGPAEEGEDSDEEATGALEGALRGL